MYRKLLHPIDSSSDHPLYIFYLYNRFATILISQTSRFTNHRRGNHIRNIAHFHAYVYRGLLN